MKQWGTVVHRVVAVVGAAWLVAGVWVVPAHSQQLPDYTLSPGDQLEISVWKEPDLTKTVVVRPDG